MSTPRPSSPLLALLARGLEAALNRALALDPEAAARLAPLEGRRLDLAWGETGLAARLTVTDGRLVLGPVPGDVPDLAVRANLAGLVGFALAGRGGPSIPAGRVQVAGDAELARRLAQLVERWQPDLDAALERAMGPAAGAFAARGLREGLDWARRGARALAEDTGTWLREDSALTVDRAEIEAHHDAVDTLRDDVERLAARVARLAAGSAR